MIKTLATVFGVVMLAAGALGFVPGATTDGMLLGVFHVNPAHNIIHLLTGAVGLWAGLTSVQYSRLFFQIAGVVYAVVTAMGYFAGDEQILGVVANNAADTWLHGIIAAASLGIDFGLKDEEEATTAPRS